MKLPEEAEKPAVITIKMEVEIRVEDFDSYTLSWVEELKDKAQEQGAVTKCELSGLPPTLSL